VGPMGEPPEPVMKVRMSAVATLGNAAIDPLEEREDELGLLGLVPKVVAPKDFFVSGSTTTALTVVEPTSMPMATGFVRGDGDCSAIPQGLLRLTSQSEKDRLTPQSRNLVGRKIKFINWPDRFTGGGAGEASEISR